ncbi:MAG: molybdenum cofactor biosynthesis protein MoaE [Planctomycetales bacterium]|nr:molybdenum cofactor biosynthesis protein MoaE [Planctomycetales bacterium]
MFRVVEAPIAVSELLAAVSRPGAGAVALFLGTVRDESAGRRVERILYEAHAPMARAVLERIGREIESRWPGARAAIVHRVGTLALGEASVAVAVSSPHRAEAFEACRHAIERVKADAPIWKKEYGPDGEEWVEPTART